MITPVTVTGFVFWWVFQRVDGLLGRFLYPAIGMRIHGLGLIALLLGLIAIGCAVSVPTIVGYTIWSYRVFWGKVRPLSYA